MTRRHADVAVQVADQHDHHRLDGSSARPSDGPPGRSPHARWPGRATSRLEAPAGGAAPRARRIACARWSQAGGHGAPGGGVELLVLPVGVHDERAVGVDDPGEASGDPRALERRAVEHRRRPALRPLAAARRPRCSRTASRRRPPMVAAPGHLAAVRRERASASSRRRAGPSSARPPSHDGTRSPSRASTVRRSDVDRERAGRVGDRRLRAGEELHVALAGPAPAPGRSAPGRRRSPSGDLLDDDLDAERQRQRRVDLDRPERAEVDRDEVVGRDGVAAPRAARGSARPTPS